MTNRSHNTLVIGDKLQNTAAVGKVVEGQVLIINFSFS